MTTEERFKHLGSIPELEMFYELRQMFKLAFYEITNQGLSTKLEDEETINKTLGDLINSLGNGAIIYSRFLRVVEETPLPLIKEKDKLEYLYNFNLNMAKTVNELIRLSVFCMVNNEDIHNGYTNLCREFELEEMATQDHQLGTLMSFSRYTNIQSQVYNNPEVNLRPAIYIQAENDFDIPTSEAFFTAGKILNSSFLMLYQERIFNIIMACTEFKNSLSLGEIKKDNKIFSEKILQLWVNIFSMLDVMGHNWDSVQRIYSVIHENTNKDEKTN